MAAQTRAIPEGLPRPQIPTAARVIKPLPLLTLQRLLSPLLRRPLAREAAVLAAFAALTVLMTWPWALHWRDAVPDAGDPYLVSWILWWDFHQTFTDPLNLFHANIFYPYRYTLAFSEHSYGLSLLFFPLFALGVRPLTVHSLATLFGFAFCGYGMFRLARTLTGSSGVAWIAGIAFAFVPFRFDLLPHLMYLSAGWVPLLFEALVLFARRRSWRRAAWLGAVFLLNALTCLHWFVLTLIPLAAAGALLLTRYGLWRERAFWGRGAAALAAASLLLLPFLIPYARASQLYGFTRSPQEVWALSPHVWHWLVGPARNKLWAGFGTRFIKDYVYWPLFPGLLMLLLPLAAMVVVGPAAGGAGGAGGALTRRRRALVIGLDLLALALALDAFYVFGAGRLELKLFGATLVTASDTGKTLFYLPVALLVRCGLAYPNFLRARGATNLLDTLRSARRGEAFWLGLVWAALGFSGSLGMNFGFHRLLYESAPLFRSIRAPGRWAMIAYVGLALLAGLGARQLAEAAAGARRAWLRPAAVYALVAAALLFELRAAPLVLERGAADPDELSLRLKATPMRGGVVGLPYGDDLARYYYVLRAADHGRPLITGTSGFTPPVAWEIEQLSRARPIPPRLLDLLEEVPASYVVVYNDYIPQARRRGVEAFVWQAVAAGRLRYVRSYGEPQARQDLYAVTKTEPEARAETDALLPPAYSSVVPPGDEHLGPPSDDPQYVARQQYHAILGREPDAAELAAFADGLLRCGGHFDCRLTRRARLTLDLLRSEEFRRGGFLIFNLHRAAHGRAPTYAEFRAALRLLNSAPRGDAAAFARLWLAGEGARRGYPPELSDDEFVARVTAASGVGARGARADFVARLRRRETTRAAVLLELAGRLGDERAEFDSALVAMQYFAHLRRDAEAGGYETWRRVMAAGGDEGYLTMIKGFLGSPEYDDKFGAP